MKVLRATTATCKRYAIIVGVVPLTNSYDPMVFGKLRMVLLPMAPHDVTPMAFGKLRMVLLSMAPFVSKI